ncbi:zinc finger protein 142 [Sphaeramia orbicularis]|uniref:C2H2-type domain-containing protein n=1 Tax=Sphaeramia orbicularis TaxID=375764 RepID=A0A673B0I2_9TELE|nr:zinc finger protein 142 [Sphaeramia orbicularis]
MEASGAPPSDGTMVSNPPHVSPSTDDSSDLELGGLPGNRNAAEPAGGAHLPTGFHVGGVEQVFHTCPQCGRGFKTGSHLQEHVQLHFPDPSLQCPSCKHHFTSRTKLRLHRLREAGVKLHRCHLCPYSAVERNAVRRHLRGVHAEEDGGGRRYPCPACGQSFVQSRSLKAHMKTHAVPPQNAPSTCVQQGCSFQSPVRKALLRHAADAHRIQAVECRRRSCGAVFSSHADMERHYQTHLAYHCSQCDFCSSNKSVLLRHERGGHPGTEKFSCDFCAFQTFNPVEFQRHLGHFHANEKIHGCPQCTYVTAHKRGLKRHMRTHSGEKPYKCSVCDFRCADESYLSRHMLIHSDQKNYMCAECGYVTKWKHYLSVHMRKHNRDFRYQCDTCPYRCHRMDQLKSHQLRHQAKSLICEICAYACKRKHELRNHMSTKHSGSGKQPAVYKCNYCAYSSCYRQALQNHENCKHTKLKEFRCVLCTYSSFSSISLFVHKRKAHGYKPGDNAWLRNYTAKEERNSPQPGLDKTPSTTEGLVATPKEKCDNLLDSADVSTGKETTASLKAADSRSDLDVVSQQVVYEGNSDRLQSTNPIEECCTLVLTTLSTTDDCNPPLEDEDKNCTDGPSLTCGGSDMSQVKADLSSTTSSVEDDDGPVTEECEVEDTCHSSNDTTQPAKTPELENDADVSSSPFPSEHNWLSESEVRLKLMKKHDRDQAEVMVLDGRVQMLTVPTKGVHRSDCKDTALKNCCNSACDSRIKSRRCEVAKRSSASQWKTRKTETKDTPTVGRQSKQTDEGTRSDVSEHTSDLQDQKLNQHVECTSDPTTSKTFLSGSLKSSEFEHQHSKIQRKPLLKSKLVLKQFAFTNAHKSVSLQKSSLCVKNNGLFKCKHCGFTSVKLSTVKQHLSTCSKRTNQTLDLDDESVKEKQDLVKDKSNHAAKVLRKRKIFSGPSGTFKCSQEKLLDGHEKYGCMKPEELQCSMCSFVAKCQMSLTQHILHNHQKKKYGKATPAHLCTCKKDPCPGLRREKPHGCHYCPFCTLRHYRLEEHETLHTGTGRHRCDVCDKAFGNVTKLQQHKRRVHDKQPSHFCPLCDYGGYTLDDVRRHNLRCHTGELRHTCTHCQARFSSNIALRNHCKRAHQLQVCFSCELCDYTCGSTATLKIHQRRKHPVFKCTTCRESFDTKEHLEVHRRSHLLHPCQVCTFAAKTRQMLAQHLLNEHEQGPSENKPLKCTTCPFACAHQLVLEQHLRSHGGKRLYECTECKYSTQNKQKMTWHVRIHTGEKPYSCEQCTYTCADPTRLKLHLRVHQDEKKFLCPECGYKCKWATQLKYHMTKHTGHKPYACTECDYRTNRADALRAHADARHRHTRPYVCENCGKAFKSVAVLKSHQRRHGDGRPYACGLCPRSFRWGAGLRQHYLNHTHKRPFHCRYCSYRAKQRFQVVKHLHRLHPLESAEQGVGQDSEGRSLTLKEALEGRL